MLSQWFSRNQLERVDVATANGSPSDSQLPRSEVSVQEASVSHCHVDVVLWDFVKAGPSAGIHPARQEPLLPGQPSRSSPRMLSGGSCQPPYVAVSAISLCFAVVFDELGFRWYCENFCRHRSCQSWKGSLQAACSAEDTCQEPRPFEICVEWENIPQWCVYIWLNE